MIDLSNISQIFVGSVEIGAVYVGSQKIWPASYTCILAPTAWNYGDQYTIDYIPAIGGYATPASWKFYIYNLNGDLVDERIVTLTNTPYIEEKINGQWVPAQHFRFENNQWKADNRGTNGYVDGSSGEPTSAGTRESKMTVSYSTTYLGVQCSATYNGIMTQNGNNAVAGTSYYDNVTVTLGAFFDTSHKAPASGGITTVSATADLKTPYIFEDAVTHTLVASSYRRQTNMAAADDFTYTGPSWVTIGTPSSSGASVEVDSCGVEPYYYGRDGAIQATYTSSPSLYDFAYIYQAQNIPVSQRRQYDQDSWAETYIAEDVISFDTTQFDVSGIVYYQYKNTYSSGSEDPDWLDGSEGVTPAVDSVSPSYDTQISGNRVFIPENTGSTDIVYTTSSTITYDGRTKSGLIANATHQASQAYIYDTPFITITYEEIGPAAHIVHPRIDVWQDVYIGNDRYDTLYGYIDDGSTSGILEGTLLPDSSFSIYSFTGSAVSGTGATFSSATGDVTTASRGTTEDPDSRDVVTNVSVTVTANGASGSSSAVDVSQAANNKTYVAPSASAVSISSLSTYDIDDTCLDTAVTATVIATWEDEGYIYDAYENGAGDLNARTGFTQHTNESVTGDDGVTIRVNSIDDYSNSTNQFYVENKYNTSQATHSVVAIFWGETSSAVYVMQAADELSEWILGNYVVSVAIGSNTVSASGGQASIIASGSHDRYRTWEDGTIQSSSTIPDTPALSLVNISEEGVFWIEGTTLKHRDMDEDETTDYVTVQATNGTAVANTNSVSAINTCTYGTVTFPNPGSTASPAGASINLNPTCPYSFTSGASGTVMGSGFRFDYIVMANENYRTYGFTGHYADFGSLGTNTRSIGNTRIKATLIADDSKDAEAVIQEEANVSVGTSLSISWSIGDIPSYGGSTSIGVASAKLYTEYSSGALDSGTTVTAGTILNNTTCQADSGITYSHTYDEQSADLSAVANEGYNPSAKEITLTTTYGGDTVTETQIVQQPVAYRTQITQQNGVTYAQIRNADTSNGHTFDYTVTIDGSDSTGTAVFNRNDSSWRTVGATQSSGHIITLTVTAQDGHNIIR